MADLLDEAQAVTEAANGRAIAAARGRLDQEGAADCADCGMEIPLARRKAMPSAKRCVDCQSNNEKGR